MEDRVGVKLDDLLREASLPREWQMEPAGWYKVVGADMWRMLPETVDEVTGHVMLELLSLSNERLMRRLDQRDQTRKEGSSG